MAGLVQFVLDITAFYLSLLTGCPLVLAHIIAFAVAMVPGFWLYSRGVGIAGLSPLESMGRWRFPALVMVSLMTLFLRGGLVAMLSERWALSPYGVVAPVALISALSVFIGHRLLRGAHIAADEDNGHWRMRMALGIIIYLGLLRLVYIGLPNLIMEEAYYWNYSQHLDWGYLDHPPMVALIIKLGTVTFGNTEFGVRIGAWLCWLVTAFFGYRLAQAMYDKMTAIYTVLLLSALTFFFGGGCLMMPDGPLAACWIGTLYFLYLALVREEGTAWFGAGLCLGLGLLSKYSIALIVPAALLFVILNGRSRRWLVRPEPYLALILAAAVFAPVIYWNATHGWASFLFQTARRVSAGSHMSLHVLIGSMLVLISPTGVMAAAVALVGGYDSHGVDRASDEAGRRRFIRVFTLVPLAVYIFFSLNHEPKLNWTGPVWLAVLPAVARAMKRSANGRGGRLLTVLQKAWMPTIIALVLIYGAAFHYLVLGIPGASYPRAMADITGWKDLQAQVERVSDSIRAQTGAAPLVVGMDLYRISSELAFYGYPDGPRVTAGAHLFGQSALMYEYWFPPAQQEGKTIILVGGEADQLAREAVVTRFDSLTAVGRMPVTLNGLTIGRYFYRVGFGYKVHK